MFRRFSGIRTVGKEIIPISEECVLRAVLGGSEVIILDTLTGDVSTVKFPGEFIACNSKCQLITTLDSHPYSIVLWKDQTVLWEKYWPSSGYSTSFSLPGIFSPADQFFVISGEGESVYVLDAFQETRFTCYGMAILDIVNLSVTNNVLSTPMRCQVVTVSDCSTSGLGSS